jgi:hypothetical protein
VGVARAVALSLSWAVACIGSTGPGAVVTGLLWSLTADGTIELDPWAISTPMVVQSGAIAVLLIVSTAVILVSESRHPCLTVSGVLAMAVVGVSAVLILALPASVPAAGHPDSSWVLVLLPAAVFAFGSGGMLLYADRVLDGGVGVWHPLRFDTLVCVGYGVSAVLLGVALDRGYTIPWGKGDSTPVNPGGDASQPIVVALPAIIFQLIVLVVDLGVLLLQGLVVTGCIVDDLETAHRNRSTGWSGFLMLDDSLMASVGLEFARKAGMEEALAIRTARFPSRASGSKNRPPRGSKDGGRPTPDAVGDDRVSLQEPKPEPVSLPREGVMSLSEVEQAERALAAARVTPFTSWNTSQVAAWIALVLGWQSIAGDAAEALEAAREGSEATGSVLVRMWLSGAIRSPSVKNPPLQKLFGITPSGLARLTAAIGVELGARADPSPRLGVTYDGAGIDAFGRNLDQLDGVGAADDDDFERTLRSALVVRGEAAGGIPTLVLAERRAAMLERASRLPESWVWTVWLPQVGLPQLTALFERARVSPISLLDMTTLDSFAALGVDSKWHQRSLRAGVKFLRRHAMDIKGEIAELRRERWVPRPTLPDHLPSWTNREVVSWLQLHLPLDPDRHGRQLSKLRESGLHGALLFSRRPFQVDDILQGFGLTRTTARGALLERIEEELETLAKRGVSAAVTQRPSRGSDCSGPSEASAIGKRGSEASDSEAFASAFSREAADIVPSDSESYLAPKPHRSTNSPDDHLPAEHEVVPAAASADAPPMDSYIESPSKEDHVGVVVKGHDGLVRLVGAQALPGLDSLLMARVSERLAE